MLPDCGAISELTHLFCSPEWGYPSWRFKVQYESWTVCCDLHFSLKSRWTRTSITYINTTTQHVRRMYASHCFFCASFALSPLFCSHLSDPYVNDPESLTSGQPSSVPAAWPLTHSHSSHAQRSASLTKPTSTGDLSYLTSYSQLTRRNFSLTLSFSLFSQILFGDMPKHISRVSSTQQKHYECPRFSPPIHFYEFNIGSRCWYCHECLK